jgi:Phage integrase family
MRTARAKVSGLLAGFRYHDLRHYLASLLIASGADVKTVQARLRHASAKTTLDTYGHCGRTATSRPAPPSRRSSPLVRTPCGRRMASDEESAGQPRRDAQTS